jgi:hypothetical protein
MGQRLHRMLAVFAIPEEKLFVQCSECDGFVKLSDVGYTDYEDAVCAHSSVSLLIMTQVTAVPISSLSTMEVNVDDW